MTLYSACCAPLSANDDRKPEFVGYVDYRALEEERDQWKRRAEEDEKLLCDVCANLCEIRTY